MGHDPRARQRAVATLSPFCVDVGDQEALRRRARRFELDRQRDVEDRAVLRIDVVAVLLGRESRMAVGRNHQQAVHGRAGQQGVVEVAHATPKTTRASNSLDFTESSV